jgi:hypothetical protein
VSDFQNYFNYFTEIEEHFQRARGTSLFLLSPLDWALIESWKTSGIPLVAVLRGIDAAFEKWKGRRNRSQMVNSLAFCSQEVLKEAQRVPGSESEAPPSEPFANEEVTNFLQSNLAVLRDLGGFDDIANGLAGLLEGRLDDLADLDQRLTIFEQKMIAIARASETEDDSLAARRELESQLRPYRRKMSAAQLDMLERQFLERKLLERRKLPRLSLFYLR